MGTKLASDVRLGSALIGALVTSASYVHFRGRERLTFMRQLGDHSTLLAPYNTFIYLTSVVPNTPMLRVDDFPELAVLHEAGSERRVLVPGTPLRSSARFQRTRYTGVPGA